jgi:hypothetical protein
MRHRQPNKGKKPAVAHVNEQTAQQNIERKYEVLKLLVRRLQPEPQPTEGDRTDERLRATVWKLTETALKGLLPTLPTSLRQFNSWTSESLPVSLAECVSLKTNAQATIKKSGFQARVDALVKTVGAATSEAAPTKTRQQTIANLEREVRLAKVLQRIAERDAMAVNRKLRHVEQLLATQKNATASAERQGKLLLDRANEELRHLRQAKRPPQNVVPIGATKRGAKK